MDLKIIDMRMRLYMSENKRQLALEQPVVICVKMKNALTFKKGFVRPFDEVYERAMNNTMLDLCKELGCCKVGYRHTDEIHFVLYAENVQQHYLAKDIQRLCSTVASRATIIFNKHFSDIVQDYGYCCCLETLGEEVDVGREEDYKRFETVYMPHINTAYFEVKAYNIPMHELNTYMAWCEQFAINNSIKKCVQTYKPTMNLTSLSNDTMLEMLKGTEYSWDKLERGYQRGVCCYRTLKDNGKKKWTIDHRIPLFWKRTKFIDKIIKGE